MDLNHRLQKWAIDDPLFPGHMSFIIGPRQCGKTTLALQELARHRLPKDQYYYNWDRADIRRKFKDDINWLSGLTQKSKRPLLVFDEIHKVRSWKRLLKGIYDQYHEEFQFLITGSGRLDFYQRGGDSLAGRYDPYFLQPFTPGIIEKKIPSDEFSITSLLDITPLKEEIIAHWEATGGFPEPLLSGSAAKAKAWWKQYQIRVTEEDLRDLTRLESVDLMRDILELLPARIGAPLSLNAIREDTETSFATVKRYISTLNQLFLIFSIPPFSKKIHRAIKKEQKSYFFHLPAITDPGARHENAVALLLLRWVSEQNERGNGEYGLHYLRDQDRREVDFLLTKDRVPFMLVEAKVSETTLSPSLRYYSEKLKVPGVQVIRSAGFRAKKEQRIALVSIHSLSALLG